MSTHPDLKFTAPVWGLEMPPDYDHLVEPLRVILGHSWTGVSLWDLVPDRNVNSSDNPRSNVGFRLVRDE